jgi:8-amino-7-oxononanoate synthase
MGVHGACIAGSKELVEYLINFGRSFIYTTSLPPHSIVSISESFNFLEEHISLQNELIERVELFRAGCKSFGLETKSNTAIQPILIPGNSRIRKVSNAIQESGLRVSPILSPTVKEGSERLRISLHVHNSKDEIISLCHQLKRHIT